MPNRSACVSASASLGNFKFGFFGSFHFGRELANSIFFFYKTSDTDFNWVWKLATSLSLKI
jgi:hypothetical protein